MKKFVFLVTLLLSFVYADAQNPDYSNGVSFKTLFLDYQSQQGGSLESFKDYHHGFEIGFQRKISKGLSLAIPFKFGTVEEYNTISKKSDVNNHKQIASLDAQFQYHLYNGGNNIVPYLMAGAGGVMEFDGEFNVQVPLGMGVNFRAAKNAYINLQAEYRYAFLENRNNLQYGLGFIYLWGAKKDSMAVSIDNEVPAEDKMKVDENKVDENKVDENKVDEEIKIEEVKEKKDDKKMSDDKKKPIDSDRDGIEDKLDLCPDQAGPEFMNGCPDSDKDGIADFQDNCPDVRGSRDMKGCPDSDEDGVADNDDECPNMAGPASNKGCPLKMKDTDGDGVPDDKDKCPDIYGVADNAGCPLADKDNDGVPDKTDKCPDVKGPAASGGCPDTDGDGVIDPDDRCPTVAGLKVYKGCPDTDGDGLDDSIDKCPNTPGTVASNGCPDITVEDRKTLDIAMRAVQFETGKATLKVESFNILKQIAGILSRYPDYNLAISGHTDNTGSSVANQELSEKRAKACHDYLITQGISVSRLSFAGYGESRPVSDNTSENGRTLNRRVEFNLNPR